MPRLSLVVTTELAGFLREIAVKYGITVDEVFSRAVVGLQLIRLARRQGLPHVGFVSDPRKLDAELRDLLPQQPHLVDNR